MRVIDGMSALYILMADGGNDQIVRRPRPTDAVGGALRGAYRSAVELPADMIRLVRRLDRTC